MLCGIGAGVVSAATSADVALSHVRGCRVLTGGAAVRFPGLHIAGTRFVRAFLSGLLDNHCYLRLKGKGNRFVAIAMPVIADSSTTEISKS